MAISRLVHIAWPALVLLACSLTDVRLSDLNIIVADQQVTHDQLTGRVHGEFQITIRNEGAKVVYPTTCLTVLQRRDGADWDPVWSSVCSALGVPDPPLEPGDSLKYEVMVGGLVAESSRWNLPVEGSYRIVVPTGFGATDAPVEHVTSNEFLIEVR